MSLVSELRSLRRGSGLSPSRLASCPELFGILGQPDYAAGVRRLIELSGQLTSRRDVDALRCAFEIGYGEHVTLTGRRRGLAMTYNGVVESTVIAWENQAIDNLVLLLGSATPMLEGPARLPLPVSYKHLHLLALVESAKKQLVRVDGVVETYSGHTYPLFDVAVQLRSHSNFRGPASGLGFQYRAPERLHAYHMAHPRLSVSFIITGDARPPAEFTWGSGFTPTAAHMVEDRTVTYSDVLAYDEVAAVIMGDDNSSFVQLTHSWYPAEANRYYVADAWWWK